MGRSVGVREIMIALAFVAVGGPAYLYTYMGKLGIRAVGGQDTSGGGSGGAAGGLDGPNPSGGADRGGGYLSGLDGPKDEPTPAPAPAPLPLSTVQYRATLRLDEVGVEVISWDPRVQLLHDFLSEDEAHMLIGLGVPRLKESKVVSGGDGSDNIKSNARTSNSAFLVGLEDHEGLSRVEERLAWFSGLPREHSEGIQVLRYEEGQQYLPHMDYFPRGSQPVKDYGQRIATVLLYLSNVEEGGETIFPSLSGNCSCGGKQQKGLSVRPKRGSALLWWNLLPDGTPDQRTLHGGCPVVQGTKWSATRWIREKCYGANNCAQLKKSSKGQKQQQP